MKSPSITSLLLTAALATAAAVPAMAVDLLPPPELPAVGCLYARLDGGGAFRNRPTVFRNLPPDYDLERGFGSGTGEALNERLDDTGFIEGGLGCQVNDLLRVDATGGYRFRSSLVDGNDTLRTELETVTVFANAYWDITNYGGFTPYVGGGAGAAFHRLSNITAPLDASDGGTPPPASATTSRRSSRSTSAIATPISARRSPAARCRSRWTS